MTRLDELGKILLFDTGALQLAKFTSRYPMQPRNPEGLGVPGESESRQLQVWISGPARDTGAEDCLLAVVVLSNLGPDLGQGGFGTQLRGEQSVAISLGDMFRGSSEGFASREWHCRCIWGAGGMLGGDLRCKDRSCADTAIKRIQAILSEGQSALYTLTSCSTARQHASSRAQPRSSYLV
eukprot:TRINITY_DN47839_c0_g1_i1.p1 TRINITY_DN47839_c0_g1~~TRINITY_DN47839_c0_g1_i1.p1  ORF type:complete len:208 (+),score=40.34 TRINITY_DN47839_c0_g1_i1:83-625(+)